MKNRPVSFLIIILLLSITSLSAQSIQWQKDIHSKRNINTIKQFDFSISNDYQKLKKSKLQKISLPDPDGNSLEFTAVEKKVMEDELANKYPHIKTYQISSSNGEYGIITLGKKGMHAMVFQNDEVFYIDPVSSRDNVKYQSYYRKDLDWNNRKEFIEEEPINYNKVLNKRIQNKVESGLSSRRPPSGTTLRTYRIAIAATGEYTQFHGGTVEDALEAIVVSLARVNIIYEREVAITMILVANNDQIIYTSSSSDPFSNSEANKYINEVQADIDQKIGTDNYDIGHGFSTGAGGLASLGSVCNVNRKASGVTGTNNPIGDPFDVDYVAHEIGHQFGAPHTFNGVVGSCAGGNRSGATAYEPGSGVTIMAYAGICGSDNIAQNSIPYFHATSLDYITTFSQEAGGATCAVTSDTGNNIPTVEAGAGGFTIPISTPFELTGEATDPDGHELFYSWEQFDLGPAGNPNSPSGTAPLFRPFPPRQSNTRIFPQISDILNGSQTIGEILPDYEREMNFVLTVRDGQDVAGVNRDFISFDVTEDAGPFLVDSIEGTYEGGNVFNVRWDVANTNLSPVNCQNVNILLSIDGGNTYPTVLASNTANDGVQEITWPNIVAENAKIKVEAANNIFFNLSGSTFSLIESTVPRFFLSAEPAQNIYCAVDDLVIDISTEAFLGFNETITLSVQDLSTDFAAVFSSETLVPGESATLTISNTNSIATDLNFNIIATTTSFTENSEQSIKVISAPEASTIIGPADASTNISLTPTIFWEDNNEISSYDIEIFAEASYTTLIESSTNISSKEYTVKSQLESAEDYFIKLVANNSCGTSAEATSSFQTANLTCNAQEATDLPIAITTSVNTITSTINFSNEGVVENVYITDITGTHTYVSDLTFSLISPAGTKVRLLSQKCGDDDDFNISFSDTSSIVSPTCPLSSGQNVKSEESLSGFAGENALGEWTLEVVDAFNQDGGQLSSWSLNICTSNSQTPPNQPSQLAFDYLQDQQIQLNWVDASDTEDGFIIQRSINGSNFVEIDRLGTDANSYNTSLPTIQDSYSFRVVAYNSIGLSYSNVVTTSVIILEQVNMPSGLNATYIGNNNLDITWNDNSENENNFVLLSGSTPNDVSDTLALLSANDTTYTLNLPNTDTLYIKVGAYNEFASSANSDVYAVSLRATTFINAPSNLTVEYLVDGFVRLNWEDNSDLETSYVIESKLVSDLEYTDFIELDSGTTNYDFLLPSFTEAYNYKVYGKNEFWESERTNPAAASIAILSNKEDLKSAINLFPNPSKGVLNISNTGQREITEILILDLKGSVMKRIKGGQERIELNFLGDGLYIIQVYTSDEIYSERIALKK